MWGSDLHVFSTRLAGYSCSMKCLGKLQALAGREHASSTRSAGCTRAMALAIADHPTPPFWRAAV
eukprot:15467620-Alexandrium_andersonii.AAC.1